MTMDRSLGGTLWSKLTTLVRRFRVSEARKRQRAAAATKTIEDLVSGIENDVSGADERIDAGLRQMDKDLAGE